MTDVAVSAGKLLLPGQTALSLSGTEGLQMRATFSENIISSVSIGQPAKITGNGFLGTACTGQIVSLNESAKQIVRTTGTETVVEGIISVDQPAGAQLRPGYNAQAEIVTDVHENALLIPYEAIGQDEENRKYVYELQDGWAYRRYIETGIETAEGMEVLKGADEGWEVVANPSALKGRCARVISRGIGEGAQ